MAVSNDIHACQSSGTLNSLLRGHKHPAGLEQIRVSDVSLWDRAQLKLLSDLFLSTSFSFLPEPLSPVARSVSTPSDLPLSLNVWAMNGKYKILISCAL